METYIKVLSENNADMAVTLRDIVEKRQTDVDDFNNLPNIYVSGRKVGKIPVSSSDVSSSDNVGDINYDSNFLYILVNIGGTALWRRAALGSW